METGAHNFLDDDFFDDDTPPVPPSVDELIDEVVNARYFDWDLFEHFGEPLDDEEYAPYQGDEQEKWDPELEGQRILDHMKYGEKTPEEEAEEARVEDEIHYGLNRHYHLLDFEQAAKDLFCFDHGEEYLNEIMAEMVKIIADLHTDAIEGRLSVDYSDDTGGDNDAGQSV